MKSRIRNAVLVCIVFSICSFAGMAAAAQSPKIGVVSIQEIILQSKAGQGAQQALQAE